MSPICRDCGEGKHAACIGSAFVETDAEVEEVACECGDESHEGEL